jgi:hypothetical protein
MLENRTLYPTTVVAPADSPRLLISGINQRKLGNRVVKGEWAGMPFYALTLEERATCPNICPQLDTCYGNAMHFSRRHKADVNLTTYLQVELQVLAEKHPKGFVVRLHVLGDFFSVRYADFWYTMLRKYKPLHIQGFTAHVFGLVHDMIQNMNVSFPHRCYVRISGVETKVIMDEEPGIVTCPAQTGKTACCGTCALCWTPAFRGKVIGFIKHGKKKRAA